MHEATAVAGGRCRSYHDAAVGMTIDNGNHLLLSGNRAALDYLRGIGAERRLVGPPAAEFPFVDVAGGKRWTLRFNAGRVPWWIFAPRRRVPGTRALDYLALARLVWPKGRKTPGKTVGEVIGCEGPLYSRLVEPLLLAALNIDPPQGSAKLAGAVIRETLLAGGRACRPLIARDGLSATLIEPALAVLQRRGAAVRLEHRLRALRFGSDRVDALDFGAETIALADDDAVIARGAALYRRRARSRSYGADRIPRHRQRAFPGRAAGRLAADPRRAQRHGAVDFQLSRPAVGHRQRGRSFARYDEGAIGQDHLGRGGERDRIAAIAAGGSGGLPPWQIVRERRATFAATPEQDAKRPGAETAWRNLALAGDWTNTGLPATIEGAIRSGNRAAAIVARGK